MEYKLRGNPELRMRPYIEAVTDPHRHLVDEYYIAQKTRMKNVKGKYWHYLRERRPLCTQKALAETLPKKEKTGAGK